ncbi:MAG: DUF4249 family protein [bacterium]
MTLTTSSLLIGLNLNEVFEVLRKLTLLLLLATGCSQNPVVETDINQLVVRGVLSPEFDHQTILVEQGTNILLTDGLKQSELAKPVEEAVVIVNSDGREVVFQEVAPGEYQDIATPLNVEPGKTYSLRIQDKQGHQLSAKTTVPGHFEIVLPIEGASYLPSQQIEFKWQPSPHVGIYAIGLVLPEECAYRFDEERRQFNFVQTTKNTETSIPFVNSCAADQSALRYWRVVAYDSAFAAYQFGFFLFGDNRPRDSNIEGGLGVFGSMVSDSVTVVAVDTSSASE